VHVNGVAVVILTIWTCLLAVFRLLEAPVVDTRQNHPWRQHTWKWFYGSVTRVSDVIFRWLLNVWGWPSRFRPFGTPGTAPEKHFRTAATVENAWNLLAQRGTIAVHRKTQTDAQGTALKYHHLLWSTTMATRSKTTNITWPSSEISNYVNATIETWRVWWTFSNCAKLLQSIPDKIIRGGSKPEVVFPRGSRVS